MPVLTLSVLQQWARLIVGAVNDVGAGSMGAVGNGARSAVRVEGIVVRSIVGAGSVGAVGAVPIGDRAIGVEAVTLGIKTLKRWGMVKLLVPVSCRR